MNYNEVVEWLFNIRRFGTERTLEPIIKLLSLIGDPHKKIKFIHVGGTNGKGSTSAMIAAILQSSGFKVGLFTSPHLVEFTERIKVNGKEISKEDVIRLAAFIKPKIESLNNEPARIHPLFFDIVTAIALQYFYECEVDFAVMEVGMGGRLDATNVIDPLVSVITNVSLEHTEVLGDTVLKIALEKAGIIKKQRVLITGTQNPEVYEFLKHKCLELDADFYHVGSDITYQAISSNLYSQKFKVYSKYDNYLINLPLLGSHQIINCSMAIGAVDALRKYSININKKSIESGLQNVNWPGRFEVMQEKPLFILDSAKDEDAFRNLAQNIINFKHDKLILILSISSDKRLFEMLSHIIPVVDYFIITMHTVMGRAAKPETLTNIIKTSNKPLEIKETVFEAINRAKELAKDKDIVLITGSVFLIGEARQYWKNNF
ncbi:bifunctional folylpolyglutamate synthase/dihydrofolate synthase [Candidatus Bathyarchaeota archaeon]|nr:bifunctional folylpolyglutamate synthase/dihydrofolate synthase [Candidatus Bathyarchaeota archaeon]